MTSSRRGLALLFVLINVGAWAAESGGPGLQPGTLPASWPASGPDCVAIPDWHVHQYNEDFYILRESGCVNDEKPFLYLIFGQDKVLLEDTGAGRTVQTAPIITDLIQKWAISKKRSVPAQIVVIHSHGHGDHLGGDKQFQALPNVQFIAAKPEEVQAAAGIANWPADLGKIDLGGRMIDVIPIPGHHEASIALYDRLTGNLLTGDSLYPGRLSVVDMAAASASAQRLADFVMDHRIAHVLGTHVEQTKTPYVDYPDKTTYQPSEHVLELTRANVLELNQAFIAMKGVLTTVALPEFTVMPRAAGRPRQGAPK